MSYLNYPENTPGRGPEFGEFTSGYTPARHAAGGGPLPTWPLLADDFFRLAHDELTGKPRLNPRDLGVGLAAALLGELTEARKVEPRAGMLLVCVGAHEPPTDALAHTVLDQIVRDPQQHDLRAWLVALGMQAYEQVAGRLLRAGHVERVGIRHRWRADEVRYVPVDRNEAAMPWARLSLRLRNGQTLNTTDAFLAGLVAATGLIGRVLEGAPRDAMGYLHHLIQQLPIRLRELATYTEVVVGEAVLGHRR